MASESSCQIIIVHVLDANDNIPKFLEGEYIGTISESATLGSYVQMIDDNKKRYENYIIEYASISINIKK